MNLNENDLKDPGSLLEKLRSHAIDIATKKLTDSMPDGSKSTEPSIIAYESLNKLLADGWKVGELPVIIVTTPSNRGKSLPADQILLLSQITRTGSLKKEESKMEMHFDKSRNQSDSTLLTRLDMETVWGPDKQADADQEPKPKPKHSGYPGSRQYGSGKKKGK